jgi:AraC family L-rhamnose operon regulatory protein RhaS
MAADPFSIKGVEFYGEWKAAKKPYRLPRHKNPGLEIVLVSKGELRWEVENRPVELRANTVFYTLPWQEHGGVEEMQPSCEISYLCLTLGEKYAKARRRFRFHPAFGFLPAEERAISSALTGYRAQAIPADGEAAWLVGHFFRLVREPGPLRESRARDTIKLLLAHLAGSAASGRHSGGRFVEAERRVREFTGVLARRHAEPWTLASMSEACRLGRTQFSELLKKHTGDTPVTYLNRIRLREAQRLLGESDKTITEIALAVGFNSSQYFATVFKEFTDMDASGFRAKGKE